MNTSAPPKAISVPTGKPCEEQCCHTRSLHRYQKDTADRFHEAIHALYENADREKAMPLLSGHVAGRLHRTT